MPCRGGRLEGLLLGFLDSFEVASSTSPKEVSPRWPAYSGREVVLTCKSRNCERGDSRASPLDRRNVIWIWPRCSVLFTINATPGLNGLLRERTSRRISRYLFADTTWDMGKKTSRRISRSLNLHMRSCSFFSEPSACAFFSEHCFSWNHFVSKNKGADRVSKCMCVYLLKWFRT
jgi:hypothetical protein